MDDVKNNERRTTVFRKTIALSSFIFSKQVISEHGIQESQHLLRFDNQFHHYRKIMFCR